MVSILFVDDEEAILRALRRILFDKQDQWDLEFATSGQGALEILGAKPIDIVVTDLTMPGIGGLELLQTVQERSPGAVRIVLSAHIEIDVAVGTMAVAHQFLMKPFRAQELTSMLERAVFLRSLISRESTRNLFSKMGNLPSIPHVYVALTEALDNPDASIGEIAGIVEQDPGIVAKVLHIVNTAYFGRPQRTSSITEAIQMLGSQTVRDLALTAKLFQSFPGDGAPGGFSMDRFQSHSVEMGRMAAALAPSECRQQAVTAGLLHDIGQLAMVSTLRDEYDAALVEAQEQSEPLEMAEQRVFGATHEDVGAYVLGLWSLPSTVVEAVGVHHRPALLSDDAMVGRAVCAAEFVAERLDAERGPDGQEASIPAELASVLCSLNLPDEPDALRRVVEDKCPRQTV